MAQTADDFLGSSTPAPNADAFLGADPAPPTQTLGGFGQAAGTVIPNALIDVAGMPVDTVGNLFNLGQAVGGAVKGANAGTSLPPDEKLSPDGRAGITPAGEYHYISPPELDEEGNVLRPGQETYSKKAAPEGSSPAMLQNPIDLPQLQSTEDLPGSSGNIRNMVRNLAGSNLVDVQERTALNRYLEATGEGAAVALAGGAASLPAKVAKGALVAAESGDSALNTARYLFGPGTPSTAATLARASAAGAASGAVQERAEDIGLDPGTRAALGLAAGLVAGARGPGRGIRGPAAAEELPPEPSTSEKLLDTPAIAHEGSGAEVVPKVAPKTRAEAPPAATSAAVAATRTPAAPSPGPGSPAAPEVTQAVPIQAPGTGGEPAPVAPEPSGTATTTAAAPTPGYDVQEGTPPVPQVGALDHPMRNGQPYTMVSGEQAGASPEENRYRSQALGQMLQQAGFKIAPTMGQYKGTPEQSYAVQAPSDVQRAQLENIGRVFNQESVLHVGADKTASLKFLGGNQQDQPLGRMTPITQNEAEGSDGWTRDADGNYYTAKPDEYTNAAPETKNGMGAEPEKTMTSLFGGPAKNGSMNAEKSAAGQAERVNTFKRVGLTEVRKSAINGDYRAAGTEFQTSGLKGNPAGERLAAVIDSEHNALRAHAEDAIGMSGGTKGTAQPELYSRGNKMQAPVNGIHEHLDAAMDDAYEASKIRAKGKPFTLDAFGNMLQNKKSEFLSTIEGKQLLEGAITRAKELGLTGESDVFKPATVWQAERMRQYLNDAWSPRTNKLIGALKGQLDQDVMRSAGVDLFAKGRNTRTLMSKILEEPEGVSKLLQTKSANKLGINRQVDMEDIPSYITKLPFEQFRQYVSVLEQAAGAKVPKLREQAIAAHKELRAQFANEYHDAGDNQKGQWNQKGANTYLRNNEMAMRYVFSPEEMQHFIDNDNAGRWLAMDRSYPGAEAQKQSITQHLAAMGAQHGTEAAAAGGAMLGHIPGAVLGAAIGKVAEGTLHKMAAKGAEKLIADLGAWKPEDTGAKTPKGASIPGQRGAVGNLGKQSTAGLRNKQRGGSVGGVPKDGGAEGIKQYLTDSEKKQLRSDTAQRMIDQFHALPDTHEMAAAALAGKAKRGWYQEAGKSIANVFGGDAPRFAATLAAMSPQTSVQSNFHNAVRTFINWDKAGRPQDPAKIRDIMQNSVQRQPNGEGVLHAWVPNTIRALTHPNPETLPPPPLESAKTDMLSYRHFSKSAKGDKVMLDPSYYGSGVPGAEAKRIAAGAPKVIAAYASDHPDSQVERDVRAGSTEYQVRVPRSQMYDLSADPENIKGAVAAKDVSEGGPGLYNHSTAENMLKAKGYTGYHIPNGVGIMKGQARFFKPVEGVRAGSNAVPTDLQPAMSGLQLSGPKVNSFMHNLTGNVNEVTNDAWMAAFSGIVPGTAGTKMGNGGNKAGPGKTPTYLAMNAHTRKAAAMLSHLTGEKWTPTEVQETVWSFTKTAYEYAAAHGKTVSQVLKSGEITDDLIRSTPDFHTLFSSPEHAGFLDDSRYAQNAQRLADTKVSGANSSDAGKKVKAVEKTLRPHLVSAAKRLDERLENARNRGEEPDF